MTLAEFKEKVGALKNEGAPPEIGKQTGPLEDQPEKKAYAVFDNATAEKMGAEVFLPPLSLCGDNAAMIGAQGYYEFLAGNTADMSLNAYATKSILGESI